MIISVKGEHFRVVFSRTVFTDPENTDASKWNTITQNRATIMATHMITDMGMATGIVVSE
jgi:hypothetical protein